MYLLGTRGRERLDEKQVARLQNEMLAGNATPIVMEVCLLLKKNVYDEFVQIMENVHEKYLTKTTKENNIFDEFLVKYTNKSCWPHVQGIFLKLFHSFLFLVII